MEMSRKVHEFRLTSLYHLRLNTLFEARGKRTKDQDRVLGIFLFAIETQRMYHLRQLGYVEAPLSV